MKDHCGFKEEHRLMDLRLLICTIAVVFSLFALVWDYIRPFPESRTVLIICVLSYPFNIIFNQTLPDYFSFVTRKLQEIC